MLGFFLCSKRQVQEILKSFLCLRSNKKRKRKGLKKMEELSLLLALIKNRKEERKWDLKWKLKNLFRKNSMKKRKNNSKKKINL